VQTEGSAAGERYWYCSIPLASTKARTEARNLWACSLAVVRLASA
jgi:hypothetical protein